MNKFSKFHSQACYCCHTNGQIFRADYIDSLDKASRLKLGKLERFSSLLEANVYRVLKIFQSEVNSSPVNITVNVIRQHKITVKPATERFRAIVYKVDFCLEIIDDSGDMPTIVTLIEAKGYETPEYRLKMKFLEYYDPDAYKGTIQVTERKKESSILESVTIAEFEDFLIKLLALYFDFVIKKSKSFVIFTEDKASSFKNLLDVISQAENN